MVEPTDAPFPVQIRCTDITRCVLHIQSEKGPLHLSLLPLQAFDYRGDPHFLGKISCVYDEIRVLFHSSRPSHDKRHFGGIDAQQDKPLQDLLDIAALGTKVDLAGSRSRTLNQRFRHSGQCGSILRLGR